RRNQPRRRRRSGRFHRRSDTRRRPRAAYAFAVFATFLISSISLPSRRPTADAAALPAAFTARPARLPVEVPSLLVNPCSASDASAAVAATATSSAASGLCSSFTNASPASIRFDPLEPFAFAPDFLPPLLPLPVAFFAILQSPVILVRTPNSSANRRIPEFRSALVY